MSPSVRTLAGNLGSQRVTRLALLWPKELRVLLEDKPARSGVRVESKRKATNGTPGTVAGDSSGEGEEPRQQRQQPVEPTLRGIAPKKKAKQGTKEPSCLFAPLGCLGTKAATVSVGSVKSPEVQHPPREFMLVESSGVGSTSAASGPAEPQITRQGGASGATSKFV